MNNILIAKEVILNVRSCSECGISYAVPESFVEQRRKDHKTFYCPNGHARYFPQKTDEEILKEKLQQREYELGQKTIANIQLDEQLTKIKQQVAEGKCPCCNKTFKHLANHMKNKHPNGR